MSLRCRFYCFVVAIAALQLFPSNVSGKIWKGDTYSIEIRDKSDGNVGTRAPSNAIVIGIGADNGKPMVEGTLGLNFPEAVQVSGFCDSESPDGICFLFGDYAKFQFDPPSTKGGPCGRIEWTSSYGRSLRDCFEIKPSINYYGGGETFVQRWPIEAQERSFVPFITGDHLNNGTFFAGGVLEKYWLISNGVALFFDEDVPLYYKVHTGEFPEICFTAQDDHPYPVQAPLKLSYDVCMDENVLAVHKKVQQKYFKRPLNIPEERMLLYPLWSTWAQYFTAVNQSLVLDYSRRVVQEGFELSSHIEIDDKWETCYGEETFDLVKFPDPKGMVDEIKAMGFNVTVWTHPFVNTDCPLYSEGVFNGYFVRDKRHSGVGSWWQGNYAGVIDTTNPNAVAWWHARLEKLRTEIGITSFKFDAGESNWLPYHPISHDPNDQGKMPNYYTTTFVDACSAFGGLIEVRAAHRSHKHGIFVRMMDKDSNWGYGNGLKSLIPTLFHFGILGYPFVLPDMIGGNAYGGRPSKELYIRWIQANVLMPSVQFSIVPWDYDAETVQLTKDVLAIRNSFKDEILKVAKDILTEEPTYSPINRPLWWLDPEDEETFTIDSEYTLGNDVIVAPVLDEGAVSRDIYLPTGTWKALSSSEVYTGPIWLRDVPVPLNTVPIFVRN